MSKVAYVLSGNEWSAVYGNLFEAVNRIAMLRYEGAASSGALVFAKESDNTVKTRLKRNVPLTETVWARKMIEVSTPETAIVGSDESIYGIAPRSEVAHDHFWVEFLGERKWDLKFDDKVVMRSRLELATFRRSALRREDFERTLRRALGAIDIDVNVLLEIAEVVQEQHHGALMIISSDAVSEARRLAGYGTDISVTPFDPRIVRAVTRIDGAILLDPQGNCHAVGMILDGMAHGHGVPSRGARFNSAMKYVNASSVSSKQNAWIPPSRSKEVASSLALVVSEDGHVNLFPRLRPQISKTELDKLLELALSHPKPRTVPGSVREAAERLFVEYFDYVPDELWQRILPPMRPQPGSREDVRVPRPYDRHFSDVVVDGSGLPLSKPASSRESGAPARPPKRKAVSRTSKA